MDHLLSREKEKAVFGKCRLRSFFQHMFSFQRFRDKSLREEEKKDL